MADSAQKSQSALRDEVKSLREVREALAADVQKVFQMTEETMNYVHTAMAGSDKLKREVVHAQGGRKGQDATEVVPDQPLIKSGLVSELLDQASTPDKAGLHFIVGGKQNSPKTHIQSRFEEVYEKNLWLDSESRSGPGSTVSAASGDIKFIEEMVRKLYPNQHEIHIADVPCGDMAWMPILLNRLNQTYTVHYHGYDVVPQIIAANKKKFEGQKQYVFSQLDGTHSWPAKADVLISRDVLNHLPIEDDLKLLQNFVKSGTPTLLLSNNRGDALANGPQQLFYTKGHASRPLDLEEAPFSFPKASDYNGHMAHWTSEQAHVALARVKWPAFIYG